MTDSSLTAVMADLEMQADAIEADVALLVKPRGISSTLNDIPPIIDIMGRMASFGRDLVIVAKAMGIKTDTIGHGDGAVPVAQGVTLAAQGGTPDYSGGANTAGQQKATD